MVRHPYQLPTLNHPAWLLRAVIPEVRWDHVRPATHYHHNPHKPGVGKEERSQTRPQRKSMIQNTTMKQWIRPKPSLLALQKRYQNRHVKTKMGYPQKTVEAYTSTRHTTYLWITSSRPHLSSATSASRAAGPLARLVRIAASARN
jgi:hypothetical protein